MVLAVHDISVLVKVNGVDAATTDIVGCSYNKAGSTNESKKAKDASVKAAFGVFDEASSAADVMMG